MFENLDQFCKVFTSENLGLDSDSGIGFESALNERGFATLVLDIEGPIFGGLFFHSYLLFSAKESLEVIVDELKIWRADNYNRHWERTVGMTNFPEWGSFGRDPADDCPELAAKLAANKALGDARLKEVSIMNYYL